MKLTTPLFRFALIGAVVLASASTAFASLPLFIEQEGAALPLSNIAYERQRTVAIDANALISGQPLQLNLFGDASYIADQERLIRNGSGSVSWVGKVRGDDVGTVVLVHRDGVTVGSVRAGGSMFLVYYSGQGSRHTIYEINESLPAYQEEAPTPVKLDETKVAAAQLQTAQAQGGDDGSIQDLMVVYTAQAVSAVGGVTAMENLIDLGVTETNMAYDNSGITHRLNLVHTQQVDYTESGSAGTDRDRLRIDGDGFMDDVHTWRDEQKADITKLIISDGGCGIAYIMTNVSIAFEEFAFCVTWHVCVSPNYTFAHELGHIQSARHDYTVDPTTNSPYSYNHGYLHPGNQWRTVMAYSNGCGGCQRQLFWSNPDVSHPVTNDPMGIAEGQPQAADNRKTLNNTAFTVANFRVSDNGTIFTNDFESGDLTGWSASAP